MVSLKRKDTYFIFDLDGTLADTLRDIAKSVNFMLQKMNQTPKKIEDIKAAVGSGIHAVVRQLTDFQDESRIEKAVSLFRKHYEKHLLDNTLLYDGVKEFLGLPDVMASVISNKPEIFTKKICADLGILKNLDACFGGHGTFPHKPDRSGAAHIIDTFADGRTPVLVGDSAVDRETALNAHILFCFARYGYENNEVKKSLPADFAIDSFRDMNKLFC
ncbi:MAG: HAD hydrolase-like protein [Candidatus Aureabacteria bacterium]|nr:HAD hydrolase-like protein [Candidatus Auribacterota bacterium]